ncbi:MAG: nitrogen regulation protein NR(II) [Methylococcales bacterium]
MHQKILDHLSETIMLFNDDLKLTYINTAGEILFADSARHLVGHSIEQLFNDPHLLIKKDLQNCYQTGNTLVNREISLHLSGRPMTINFNISPLMEASQLIGVIVELLQIDKHLRFTKEEQLFAQQNTNRMLVRGLAHEIKNPLGGLRGAAQLLHDELSLPELKEYTQIIISESDRMQELMDKMLGPNTPPKKEPLNIHEILNRVHKLVQNEHDQITIEKDYDPSIPLINADRNMLIQAFLNIVQNATQAIDKQGRITLSTRICRQLTIGRHRYKLVLKASITDDGVGIDPDMINQIFYPMITTRADGTGLGLPIAQSLINQHNGIIECTSMPNNTIFSIYIPVENGHEYNA